MPQDPSPSNPASQGQDAKMRLTELSKTLTNLHKSLIESEKTGYENSFGTIDTPAEFLQLLMNDPWFAWMRPISELIAEMDEAVDSKEGPVTPELTDRFVHRTHRLLTPTETGEGFGRHYYDALQRDPEVVLSHGLISRMWKPHA